MAACEWQYGSLVAGGPLIFDYDADVCSTGHWISGKWNEWPSFWETKSSLRSRLLSASAIAITSSCFIVKIVSHWMAYIYEKHYISDYSLDIVNRPLAKIRWNGCVQHEQFIVNRKKGRKKDVGKKKEGIEQMCTLTMEIKTGLHDAADAGGWWKTMIWYKYTNLKLPRLLKRRFKSILHNCSI